MSEQKLPYLCPFCKEQLPLVTESELWSMCDKCGAVVDLKGVIRIEKK